MTSKATAREVPEDLELDEHLPLPREFWPNIDDLEIEDGKPLDSIFQEKQHRLLTAPLFDSWPGPGEGRPFMVYSNVGLFFAMNESPLVPDVMLSLDVPQLRDRSSKENNSYLMWVVGKPPTVVFEFVSDRRGGEATHKFRKYAELGVGYYVLFDPKHRLSKETLQVFHLLHGNYQTMAETIFPAIGLGVTLWQGVYETLDATWLRWCDANGRLIPTGKELAEEARQKAEEARQKAEEARQIADEARQKAEEAEARAGKVEHRASRLAAKLRELGIDPDTVDGG